MYRVIKRAWLEVRLRVDFKRTSRTWSEVKVQQKGVEQWKMMKPHACPYSHHPHLHQGEMVCVCVCVRARACVCVLRER